MTVWHIPHLFKRLTDPPDQSEHRVTATLLSLPMSVLLGRVIHSLHVAKPQSFKDACSECQCAYLCLHIYRQLKAK